MNSNWHFCVTFGLKKKILAKLGRILMEFKLPITTSGLVSLGFIDANRKLTEAGRALLTLSEQNNFAVDNIFGLPADSFIYFKQLLKTSLDVEKSVIRPFVIAIYLIEKLDGLSYD